MGSCRKPPPGTSFSAPRDSSPPIRTQKSHHVTQQTKSHVTQSNLGKGGRSDALARSLNKKKGINHGYSAINDRVLDGEFFNADNWTDDMYLSRDLEYSSEMKSSNLLNSYQRENNYLQHSSAERNIADVNEKGEELQEEREDKHGVKEKDKNGVKEKEKNEIKEEDKNDKKEVDSGGDSSSWMTQYIAHNAPLGNEKKGEPSCFRKLLLCHVKLNLTSSETEKTFESFI